MDHLGLTGQATDAAAGPEIEELAGLAGLPNVSVKVTAVPCYSTESHPWPAMHPHLRRIFDLAALYQVRSGSHGATDLSPVTLAAAVHLDLAIPNFGIQEYMGHADETHEVVRTPVHLEDGILDTAEVPGLGVEYDEKAAERFPYDPRYLPVARRLDGSVHDW